MTIPSPEELIHGAARDSFMRRGAEDANAWQRSARVRDSFQNFAAQVGIGTNNLSTGSNYGFNPITRVRTLLEWMYRGSWIVGKAVDAVAEDMTKAGISWIGSQAPEDQDKINTGIRKTQMWKRLQQGHKWSRLYGGAIVVMMIDGQKLDTPLDVERIRKGQFKGFVVLDRWMINPSFGNLVDDPASPHQGFPEWYDVVTYAPPALIGKRVHHSRCFRMIGVELPYWQMVFENYWGMSILERLYDRLVAFDSGTQGAAQLMYRCYLRTLKVKDLRKIVAAGGPAYNGLVQQIQTMRLFQSNEGISTIDAEDTLEAQSYSFAGLSDMILQMGQQLAGAIDTPLVRLFGQAPAGLNSTGESDMRIYYDGILQRQENDMRPQLEIAVRLIAVSEGVRLSDDFGFRFNPLWQLTDDQKSTIAQRNTQTVMAVQESGIVSEKVILKELKQQSETTGMWTNITDEEIEAAADEPLPGPDELGVGDPDAGPNDPRETGRLPKPKVKPASEEGAQTKDNLPLIEVAGIPCVIENPRGSRRQGPGWSVIMPADYGYVRGTGSAEGIEDSVDGLREQMDIFVGPDRDSEQFWVVDQCNPTTGQFDEHKIMAGFTDQTEALDHYRAAYQDAARGRIMGCTHMNRDQLLEWLESGDLSRALAVPREAVL